jgi:hypothetical protein
MALSPYRGLLGKENPVSQFIDPRRNALMGFSAGMLSGNPGMAMTGAMQGSGLDQQYAQLQADQAQQEQETNATRAWLEQSYPEYSMLPPGEGFKLAMAAEQAKRSGGGAGNESFFGNIVPMQDAEGNLVLGQASNQGRWQPLQGAEGMSPAPTTKTVDIGNYIVTQDVYGNELYRTPKSGDVPTGYGAPDQSGTIAPMPGSPQEREIISLRNKAQGAATSYAQRSSLVGEDIDRAVNIANTAPSTGAWSILNAVPGTPQGDLAGLIETIEANVGFAELQQMRENSPTGGALGAVSERELALLNATMGNLKQSQSREQFVYNLERLKRQLESSKQAIQDAYMRDFGGQVTPQPAPQGAPQPAANSPAPQSNVVDWKDF